MIPRIVPDYLPRRKGALLTITVRLPWWARWVADEPCGRVVAFDRKPVANKAMRMWKATGQRMMLVAYHGIVRPDWDKSLRSVEELLVENNETIMIQNTVFSVDEIASVSRPTMRIVEEGHGAQRKMMGFSVSFKDDRPTFERVSKSTQVVRDDYNTVIHAWEEYLRKIKEQQAD